MTSSVLFVLGATFAFQSTELRLIRSQSGPSGRVVGARFVFNEIRNRFVYPIDKSFNVYFEWQAPPGRHALTALWKGPDGRTVSISPDVNIETNTRELNAYWTYSIVPGMPSGVWTAEVRIDGTPAGSHAFELVIPEEPRPQPRGKPIDAPPQPTVDEIYRKVLPSVVWIHKLDEAGRRVDTASGFVIDRDRVATAFQAVDSAARLEIEFTNGRRQTTDEVIACNRLEDWAAVKVDTGDAPALRRAETAEPSVGERLIALAAEQWQARAIAGVDIGGKRTLPGFGQRLLISPGLTAAAAGGPLLNTQGEAVAILGGSLMPGARGNQGFVPVSAGVWANYGTTAAATPIRMLREGSGGSLKALADSGVLTPGIVPIPALLHGGSTDALPRRFEGPPPRERTEFSRKDSEIWVYTVWQRQDKLNRGMISGRVYDARNTLRVGVPARKLSLPGSGPVRSGFRFSPGTLEPGQYRVDVIWDNQPVWRTFVSILD